MIALVFIYREEKNHGRTKGRIEEGNYPAPSRL